MALNTTVNGSGIPPNLCPLTPEEESLLNMYAIIKTCEREASKLREKAAKDKLTAADEKYQREQATGSGDEGDTAKQNSTSVTKKQKKKTKKEKKKSQYISSPGTNLSSDENMSDSDESEDSEADEELKALRKKRDDQIEEKIKAEKAIEAQELLRDQHLQSAEIESVSDLGPSLLKKQRRDYDDGPQSSLIANLEGQVTPPHDFSKGLKLSRISGSVLFPFNIHEPEWSPPFSALRPDEGCLEVSLPDFDSSQATVGKGKNTVAIKFTAPEESKRFSINIAVPNHKNYDSVLFHFNPRQRQKGGQLVINDKKDGIWGQGINVPLSQVPIMFGQTSCTLMVQINGEGFDIFVEGKHCARLEHRTELPAEKGPLILQFPSTDDYGKPENWTVYKVWWGHKPNMATGDVSGVAGVNSYNSIHPRKLFISGFTKIFTDAEVDLRRAELERDFRKYGGALGAVVNVQTNSTFAFVEVENETQADRALVEMNEKYNNRINRARRSRYEALQEERAAKEKAGGKKESSEWD